MATSGGSGGQFEVGGRKQTDMQNAKNGNSAKVRTIGTDPLTFEVSGRNQKHGQVTAIQNKQDYGTVATTSGTKAISIVKVGGRRGTQVETRAAYTNATLKRSLDVFRPTDDVPCDLRGVVLLPDKMVVSDEANYKLKVFGSDFTFWYEYKCRDLPYDIAMLDNKTIVVTFRIPYAKLFSVGNDGMKETRTINTEYCNFGVCCCGGNIYCVVKYDIGSERSSQVRMYTPEGKLKRRYEYLSDGKVEYNNLDYITINPQTGILYVADWDKGVLALSTSGDVIAVMSPPQLDSPQGIDIDDHGHIYVCGLNSHNVMQLSGDGQNVVELLSKSIRCNLSQFAMINGNLMFLGRRKSNIISVYELS